MRYFYLLSAFLLSLSFNVLAKTNVDIYQVEIPVSDAVQTQEQALQQGMTQVLVRATGDTGITKNSVIKNELTKGANYLTQSGRGKTGDTSTFIMGFNGPQIQALLKKSKATIWPVYRKNILVWIVEDKDLDRKIAWEQSDLPSIPVLQQATSNAGLPITLPIGDIDDMSMISSSDLWGNFAYSVSQASARYPVDAVLVMKVGYADGEAQVDWTLYDATPSQLEDNQNLIQKGSESGELSTSIQASVASITQYYVQKDAVKVATETSSKSTVEVNIAGIDSSVSVFRLPKQLMNLSSVANVQLNAAQGDVVSFHVGLSSSLNDFEKDIKNSRQFSLTDAPYQPESQVTVTTSAPTATDPTTTDVDTTSASSATSKTDAGGIILPTDTAVKPVEENKMEQVWIRFKG